jgi:hypothetical protein
LYEWLSDTLPIDWIIFSKCASDTIPGCGRSSSVIITHSNRRIEFVNVAFPGTASYSPNYYRITQTKVWKLGLVSGESWSIDELNLRAHYAHLRLENIHSISTYKRQASDSDPLIKHVGQTFLHRSRRMNVHPKCYFKIFGLVLEMLLHEVN